MKELKHTTGNLSISTILAAVSHGTFTFTQIPLYPCTSSQSVVPLVCYVQSDLPLLATDQQAHACLTSKFQRLNSSFVNRDTAALKGTSSPTTFPIH